MDKKFSYTVKILAPFSGVDWNYIFDTAIRIENSIILVGGWLYGIKNSIEFGNNEQYLTSNQFDQIAKMFQFHKDKKIFDKCVEAIQSIVKEYERLITS